MRQAALEGLRKELDTFVPRVQQVMRQAKQRIFGGDTHVAEKLVSIFEPRWVGLGVIADNLHHIGTVLAKRKN